MNLWKEEGTTLIEAIIAMVILALVVIGLNIGVVTLIRSNINSKELTSATAVGNQVLEELRRRDYYDVETDEDSVRNYYYCGWMVTELSDPNNAKKIDLVVEWPLSVKRHSIALSTIIARP